MFVFVFENVLEKSKVKIKAINNISFFPLYTYFQNIG